MTYHNLYNVQFMTGARRAAPLRATNPPIAITREGLCTTRELCTSARSEPGGRPAGRPGAEHSKIGTGNTNSNEIFANAARKEKEKLEPLKLARLKCPAAITISQRSGR